MSGKPPRFWGINLFFLKIGNPNPFPVSVTMEFLNQVEEVIVIEELDPVLRLKKSYERLIHWVCKRFRIGK